MAARKRPPGKRGKGPGSGKGKGPNRKKGRGRRESAKAQAARLKRAEKHSDKLEAKAFERRFPKAARQRMAVQRIARELYGPIRAWHNAENRVAKAWIDLENYMLGLGEKGKRPKLSKFKSALAKAQRASIRATQKAQDFYAKRMVLEAEARGLEDRNALSGAMKAEFRKVAEETEKSYYGFSGKLVDAKLLDAFAELVSRARVGRDREYLKLRQRVIEFGLISDKVADNAIERRAEYDAAYHVGAMTRQEWHIRELLSNLFIVRMYANFAIAEENLYRHLGTYATGKTERKLKRFLNGIEKESARRKIERISEALAIENEITRNTPWQKPRY